MLLFFIKSEISICSTLWKESSAIHLYSQILFNAFECLSGWFSSFFKAGVPAARKLFTSFKANDSLFTFWRALWKISIWEKILEQAFHNSLFWKELSIQPTLHYELLIRWKPHDLPEYHEVNNKKFFPFFRFSTVDNNVMSLLTLHSYNLNHTLLITQNWNGDHLLQI